jgi:MYXO-CTERM domain-containing protein
VSHETMSRPLAIAPSFVALVALVALVVLGIVLGIVMAPRSAHANGAFPESYQLVLPANRPRQIVLATNFGLIISDDDGATWTWTCEQKPTVMGALYGVSAPPLDRFFSLSTLVGLAYSDDDSCTWTSSGGSLDTALATDYFPDPTNPMRVYALGAPPNDDTVPPKVFPSDDGGKTFGAALFTAPTGMTLSGLESARSEPQTLYLATFTTGFHPKLQRSKDGGTTWTELDVEPSLGTNNFRIIAVDPNDATVLTVRVIETTGESVAISRDGGSTFTKVAHIAGQLTAYVRLDSATILVAGALAIDGVGFRSTDGGLTFTDWTPRTTSDGGAPDLSEDGGAQRPPHLRALAARGGKLYAAAKNFSDDWAVGVSTDEGVTFRRLARYDQVASIRACVRALCEQSCEFQAGAQIWPPDTCAAPRVTPPQPPAKKGCGCQVGDAGAASGAGLVLAALWLTRARRRRR